MNGDLPAGDFMKKVLKANGGFTEKVFSRKGLPNLYLVIAYTKSRTQLSHRKYLLYETGSTWALRDR